MAICKIFPNHIQPDEPLKFPTDGIVLSMTEKEYEIIMTIVVKAAIKGDKDAIQLIHDIFNLSS